MKTKVLTLLPVFMLILVVISASSGYSENQAASADDKGLPEALDNLFPPESPAPVYLLGMIKMAGFFSGIATDLSEGDLANARANFEAFMSEYAASSGLVPSWANFYSPEAVEDLGTALETGDPKNIMPAYEKVSETCNNCHRQKMTGVYFKYHWPDFKPINGTDPITNEKVSFARLMQLVDSDLNGIMNDLSQNQTENALSHVLQLEKRYETMGGTCYACHDTERKYYVDKEIFDKFDALKGSLSQAEVNFDGVGGMVQSIGMESCFKCHLVHVPAALTK